MLVVNRRPRGSLAPDLARITLTVSAPRRLGRPLPQVFANPFTRPSGLAPAICDLPIRGAALAPGELRSLLARGSAGARLGPVFSRSVTSAPEAGIEFLLISREAT